MRRSPASRAWMRWTTFGRGGAALHPQQEGGHRQRPAGAARPGAGGHTIQGVPGHHTYNVGDDVTVHAITPLMPGGFAATGQLTQIDVDAAAGTAAWTVAMTCRRPRAAESLAGRLARLDNHHGRDVPQRPA